MANPEDILKASVVDRKQSFVREPNSWFRGYLALWIGMILLIALALVMAFVAMAPLMLIPKSSFSEPLSGTIMSLFIGSLVWASVFWIWISVRLLKPVSDEMFGLGGPWLKNLERVRVTDTIGIIAKGLKKLGSDLRAILGFFRA